ncbi:MAG: Hpt domain-containing protein [Burkholderiaceae bacterium]
MPQQQYQAIDPFVLFLSVGNDLDAFRDLSKVFLKICPPMLHLLKNAVLEENAKGIWHESHALKGTASLVGATQLTCLLQEIENLSRKADIDAIVPCIPELTRLFSVVMHEVQASIVNFQCDAEHNANTTPT